MGNGERAAIEGEIPGAERTGFHRIELAAAVALFLLLTPIAWSMSTFNVGRFLAISLAALGAYSTYQLLTHKARRREHLKRQPFTPAWEIILRKHVVFYQTLEPADQARFREQLKIFLGEKRITGIGTPIDDTVRVLAAASAIIPIFGFPDWEWNQISEVLIYPNRFDQDFEFEDTDGKHVLGMVGTGAMNRIMILAKPDLLHGFRNSGDKRNVGLHEFTHLVDKTDGAIDGIPQVGLDRRFVGPWVDLVRRKMLEMEKGDSDIDPYGLTNEAEFFAVVSEYFFEKPGVMRRKHPELYAMLAQVFRQDLATRAKAMADAALRPRRRLGRNSPCPCGSGQKYKRCCLAKS